MYLVNHNHSTLPARRLPRQLPAWLCLSVLLCCCPAVAQQACPGVAQQLQQAYQGFVTAGSDCIRVNNHPPLASDDGYAPASFTDRLNHADLCDQLSQAYPRGWPFPIPSTDQDPGRLRCQAFFTQLYGDSQQQVRSQLVKVPWPPAGPHATLWFSQTAHAAAALTQIGRQLAQQPRAVQRYVATPAGTFKWRSIAGTNRLSPHSFGIAIDFKLPNGLYRYWKWDKPSGDTAPPYPRKVLDDPMLPVIVRIFEQHGFIWGGKWNHYDLMHFEYRPELTSWQGP